MGQDPELAQGVLRRARSIFEVCALLAGFRTFTSVILCLPPNVQLACLLPVYGEVVNVKLTLQFGG